MCFCDSLMIYIFVFKECIGGKYGVDCKEMEM